MKPISWRITAWLFKRSLRYSPYGVPSQNSAFILTALCSFQIPLLTFLRSPRAVETRAVMWTAVGVVLPHHLSTGINAAWVISRVWLIDILREALKCKNPSAWLQLAQSWRKVILERREAESFLLRSMANIIPIGFIWRTWQSTLWLGHHNAAWMRGFKEIVQLKIENLPIWHFNTIKLIKILLCQLFFPFLSVWLTHITILGL